MKALADWGFGSPAEPKYGHCHVTMMTGLTAKDGPDFSTIDLEKFPDDREAAIALQVMIDRIQTLQPLLDEVDRRAEKMGTENGFEIFIDAEMWERIKSAV